MSCKYTEKPLTIKKQKSETSFGKKWLEYTIDQENTPIVVIKYIKIKSSSIFTKISYHVIFLIIFNL